MVQGKISHDEIMQFLKGDRASGRELWQYVKSFVRTIESAEGVRGIRSIHNIIHMRRGSRSIPEIHPIDAAMPPI